MSSAHRVWRSTQVYFWSSLFQDTRWIGNLFLQKILGRRHLCFPSHISEIQRHNQSSPSFWIEDMLTDEAEKKENQERQSFISSRHKMSIIMNPSWSVGLSTGFSLDGAHYVSARWIQNNDYDVFSTMLYLECIHQVERRIFLSKTQCESKKENSFKRHQIV